MIIFRRAAAARRGPLACAGLAATVLCPVLAQAADAEGALYERALMRAADVRCRLFTPAVSASLAASARQAEGAALRAGVDHAAVSALQARAAAKAASVACSSPDLAKAAGRVRIAYAGYAALPSMSFPGAVSSWRATRPRRTSDGSAALPGWRVSQATRSASGPVALGMADDSGASVLTAVASWPGALDASGARLVLRDVQRAPDPYLDARKPGLAGRIPGRNMTRAFLASAIVPASPDLLGAGATAGAAFRFPAAAVQALEALDPREAVAVEFVHPVGRGERVEQALFEVGDFAAARAFLATAR